MCCNVCWRMERPTYDSMLEAAKEQGERGTRWNWKSKEVCQEGMPHRKDITQAFWHSCISDGKKVGLGELWISWYSIHSYLGVNGMAAMGYGYDCTLNHVLSQACSS